MAIDRASRRSRLRMSLGGEDGMQFSILGPTELIHNGERVPLGAAKQRGMLALLLVYAGEPVQVDTLSDYLWDKPGRADRRHIIYSMASRLRGALSLAGLPQSLTRVAGSGAYRLDVDRTRVDLHRFRALAARAHEAIGGRRFTDATAVLQEAMALWRGRNALADLRGARAELLRVQLDDLWLDAQRQLAECQLVLGRYHVALAQLEPLVRDYDLDQGLMRLWLSALGATGRADAVRRDFAAFRGRFRRAMHADPDIDLGVTLTAAEGAPSPTVRAPAPSRPQQLPGEVKDFIGRERTMRELDELAVGDTARSNVVVLTGMPGVGKTAAALRWAHRQSGRYPDGQLVVNAQGHGGTAPVEPHDVIGRLLETLGVAPERMPDDPQRRLDLYNDTLSGRRILLFIDDVVDTNQVRPLVPRSGSCLVVITSRMRLTGLSISNGVRHVTLEPLEPSDSTDLLTQVIGVQRASADPDAVRTLTEIAGGVPLALRIVGEYIAQRPRAAIADLTKDLGYRLLEAVGDEEGASLNAVLACSYEVLAPNAARLFRRLAHHPGRDIGVEPAAALDGGEVRNTGALLDSLARTHLIEHGAARRYQFHDLLRRYASSRALTEDSVADIDGCRQRMYDWYLLSAAAAAARLLPAIDRVPDLPEDVPGQLPSFAEDREAWDWCLNERENLGAVARDAAEHGFHRHAWQIPGVLYEVLEKSGRHDDILALNRLAVDSARRDGHALGEIGSLSNLGSAYLAQQRFRLAAVAYSAAHDRAHAAGNTQLESLCAHNSAVAFLRTGDADKAERILLRVLDAFRSSGNRVGEASVHHRLGDTFRQREDYSRAVGHYDRALLLWDELEHLPGVARTRGAQAALSLESGNPALAVEQCERVLRLHDRTHEASSRCDALITLADALRIRGSLDASRTTVHQALQLSETVSGSFRKAHALAVLAEIEQASTRPERAEQARATGLRICADLEGVNVERLQRRLRGC